jgi:F-type H+-transporting ATPase subunit b
MINIDGSLLVQIINFLLLIYILNTLLYKPIRGILKKRKEKVDGLSNGIKEFEADAAKQDTAYLTGIRDARTEGMKQKETIVETAREEERAILDSINAKAQAELAQVKEKVLSEANAVRQELEKEVDIFADAIGQKILGREVS